MNAIWPVLAAAATLKTLAKAAPGLGQQVGKDDYERSCAPCHGVTGKGDGPVAKSLTKTPLDLTALSKKNGGVFPFASLYDVIDGRIQVIVHGPREMPVWGDVYSRQVSSRLPRDFMAKELSEAMVRVRMLMLIEYISTLQEK